MNAVLRAQFSAQKDVGSRLIQWFSAGPYSHVDVLLDDGRLLGARSDSFTVKTDGYGYKAGEVIPPGVELRPPNYAKFIRRDIVEIPCTQEQKIAAYEFYLSQLHHPYDWRAIVAFVPFVNHNWRSPDAWYCSEYYVRGLERSGRIGPLIIDTKKIPPVMAAVVTCAVGGRIAQSMYGLAA